MSMPIEIEKKSVWIGLKLWTFRLLSLWILSVILSIIQVPAVLGNWTNFGSLISFELGAILGLYLMFEPIIWIFRKLNNKIAHICITVFLGIIGSSALVIVIYENFGIALGTPIAYGVWLFLSALFIGLEFELDIRIANRVLGFKPITVIIWGVVGGVSGFLFSIPVYIIAASMNIGFAISFDVLLAGAALTGSATSLVSVFGREERLSKSIPKVLQYSTLVSHLQIPKSEFLDKLSLTGEPRGGFTDLIAARERMERSIPWAILSWALAIIIIPPTLFGSMPRASLIFGLIASIASAFGVFLFTATVVIIYVDYKNHRRMWSKFWELARLFSINENQFTLEYIHRMVFRFPGSESRDRRKHLDADTFVLLNKYGFSSELPETAEGKQELNVSVRAYHQARIAVDNMTAHTKKTANLIELVNRATKEVESMQTLSDERCRTSIAKAHLFATMVEDSILPYELISDILAVESLPSAKKNNIVDYCTARLHEIDETPKHVIPDSLKWLPAIYVLCLGLAALLLGI